MKERRMRTAGFTMTQANLISGHSESNASGQPLKKQLTSFTFYFHWNMDATESITLYLVKDIIGIKYDNSVSFLRVPFPYLDVSTFS